MITQLTVGERITLSVQFGFLFGMAVIYKEAMQLHVLKTYRFQSSSQNRSNTVQQSTQMQVHHMKWVQVPKKRSKIVPPINNNYVK